MPYESDDEVRAGEEGDNMLAKEEEEEEEEGKEGGRHKYNYFSRGSSMYNNLASLSGTVMLASSLVFLILSNQSLQ